MKSVNLRNLRRCQWQRALTGRMKSFGEVITELRKERGLTQKALAAGSRKRTEPRWDGLRQ